jgi:hypothetical protein
VEMVKRSVVSGTCVLFNRFYLRALLLGRLGKHLLSQLHLKTDLKADQLPQVLDRVEFLIGKTLLRLSTFKESRCLIPSITFILFLYSFSFYRQSSYRRFSIFWIWLSAMCNVTNDCNLYKLLRRVIMLWAE